VDILLKSGLETGMIMLLLGLSEPFAWVVAVEQLPQQMVGWLSQAHVSPMVTLILMNIGLLLLGIPLETAPALTIVVPVLVPMAAQLGIDPHSPGNYRLLQSGAWSCDPAGGRSSLLGLRYYRNALGKAEQGYLGSFCGRACGAPSNYLSARAEYLLTQDPDGLDLSKKKPPERGFFCVSCARSLASIPKCRSG